MTVLRNPSNGCLRVSAGRPSSHDDDPCCQSARLVLQLQFHVTILAPSVMTPSRYPLMPTAPFAPSQHLLHAVPHPQH